MYGFAELNVALKSFVTQFKVLKMIVRCVLFHKQQGLYVAVIQVTIFLQNNIGIGSFFKKLNQGFEVYTEYVN